PAGPAQRTGNVTKTAEPVRRTADRIRGDGHQRPTHPDATPTRASAPVDRPVPGLAGEVVEPVVGRVLAQPAEAGPRAAADAAAGAGEVDGQANLVHRVARPCRRRRALPGGHV